MILSFKPFLALPYLLRSYLRKQSSLLLKEPKVLLIFDKMTAAHPSLFMDLAYTGNLKVLEILYNSGGIVTQRQKLRIYDGAAQGNQEKVIEWALKKKFPKSDRTLRIAVLNKNLDLADFLVENGFPLMAILYTDAVMSRDSKCLEWLRAKGCPFEYSFSFKKMLEKHGTPNVKLWVDLNLLGRNVTQEIIKRIEADMKENLRQISELVKDIDQAAHSGQDSEDESSEEELSLTQKADLCDVEQEMREFGLDDY